MKNKLITILLIFCFCSIAFASDFSGRKEKIVLAKPQISLIVGEKLEYIVEWAGLPVGRITLEVGEIVKIGNRECYHVTAHAYPNKFISRLYDLEYIVQSYIDIERFYTYRFEKARRYKQEYNYVTIDFNREKNIAEYKTYGSKDTLAISPIMDKVQKKNPPTKRITEKTQDLLSSLYYLRFLNIKEEENYVLDVYYGRSNWPVKVKIGMPFVKDYRKKGSPTVFLASPETPLSDFILGGKQEIFVYFTADLRRIPVEFSINTSLGNIRGIIKEIPK